MKKTIYAVFAFTVFAVSAMASSDLEVKIPFAFKAGASTLPAGTYRVTKVNSGCILIKGDKAAAFVPENNLVIDMKASGKTLLNFDRAGDTYVLHAVLAQ